MAVKLKGRNKYKMHQALKRDRVLRPYLPATVMFRKQSMYQMIKKYKAVVVKPTNGRQGHNVYFIEKLKKKKYRVQLNKKRRYFKSIKSVYNYVRRATKKRKYIIQQQIDLATIDGKRFDFRIIVQRFSRKHPWVVNGIIARKAGNGYKVTNKRRHGIVLPLETALTKVEGKKGITNGVVNELKKISIRASKTLGKSFSKQRIFGVDIGMTKQGSLYIFELNRWPLIQGFKGLDDQTQYKKIIAYKKRQPLQV
ncbi:YheC/D like ATP-grasp [Alteribacillus persepolensis]|uniref:YheC/D like ATP-grasp n=1 Tax=Alteribacillus persepolensis TaxID=568899 RepID=A0A1G7YY65_9BACI|nr:YheC/YheD family protein [Alteribacillus persepolensis]SDH01226.1 YheC/D like ATP-grasp [Alteribacillus persepolensis]